MSAASQLQKAHAYEQRGQLAEAMAGYQGVVDREPGNTDALFLLGRGYCQTGRFEDGAALFRKVIALDPQHAPAHTLLGRVLAQGGDRQEALTCYERAIEADPNNAMALALKADALATLGRRAEAVEAYDKALAIEPSNIAAWCNRGSTLEELDRHAEAVESFQRALALAPNMVEIHFNLANALRTSERPEEAAAHYRRAIALRPGFAEAYVNLASVLMSLSRWDEVVQCCETVGKLRPSAMPYYSLGHALLQLERYDESLEIFDKLLIDEPSHAKALRQKAQILFYLGRMDEARTLIGRSIEIDPDDIESPLLLDELDRFKPDDERAKALLERLRTAKPDGTQQEIKINFALADISRRVGEHDQAFQYLTKANALVRGQIDYDTAATERLFDRIRQAFTADYLRSMAGGGNPSSKPIFVIGMPRSGTTLTEQILAAHPRVYGAGEVDVFEKRVLSLREFDRSNYPEAVLNMAPAEFVELGASYLARVSELAPDADRIADKYLGNNVYVGLIHLALPNARIIHVRRNPVDCCMSSYSLNFANPRGVAYTYDLAELGRHYRAYEGLARHWAEVLPPGVMLEVQYEDVVDDLEGQARRIIAHCGLEWDERCLAFHEADRPVKTASAAQVRQPIYRSAIGRWQPYREHIRPLLEALELPVDEG